MPDTKAIAGLGQSQPPKSARANGEFAPSFEEYSGVIDLEEEPDMFLCA